MTTHFVTLHHSIWRVFYSECKSFIIIMNYSIIPICCSSMNGVLMEAVWGLGINITIFVFHHGKTLSEGVQTTEWFQLKKIPLKSHFNLEKNRRFKELEGYLLSLKCKMHFGSFSNHDSSLHWKLSNAVSWCSLPQTQAKLI